MLFIGNNCVFQRSIDSNIPCIELNFSIDSNIICGKYTVKIYTSPILPFRYFVGKRGDKKKLSSGIG